MARLNLHPCAVQMTWHSKQPLCDADWKNVLLGFIEDLGKNCIANGGSLIGHIKGVVTVTGKPCLQMSLVSVNQPATIDGLLPKGTQELRVTLNVLVFGMSARVLANTISDTRKNLSKSWPGSIEAEILSAATDYPLAVHGADS